MSVVIVRARGLVRVSAVQCRVRVLDCARVCIRVLVCVGIGVLRDSVRDRVIVCGHVRDRVRDVTIMACFLSTPFSIFSILKGASRVIFTNFLIPLTRPHSHVVRRKVIIISNCRLVPY